MKPATIATDGAPAALGYYSQGKKIGNLVFTSGQLAIDPATGEKLTGSIEEQTDQALRNVLAIVEAAGGSAETVPKTTAFIADAALWSRVNEVYTRFFRGEPPARSVVPCKELPFGFLIEIEAVAAVPE